MYRMLSTSLAHAMAVLSSSDVVAASGYRDVAEDLVNVAVELTSRIVFRLPENLILNEFRRAISVYRSPVFAHGIRIMDALKNLFKRTIVAMDSGTLSTCCIELFSLPVPGVAGFSVPTANNWPEPTSTLSSASLGDMRQSNPNGWSQVINWLLNITSNTSGEARQRASERLAVLWDKGVLTSTEIDAFSAAIWAIRDIQTKLPTSSALLPNALLCLPEPEPGISAALVKASCLGSDFVPLCHTVMMPDGKTVKNFTFGTDPGSFLDTIVGVTRPKRRDTSQRECRWIEWRNQELNMIFDKIRNWWQNEGKTLCSDKQRGMTRDQILERHEKNLRVIWRVLLPHCRPGDELSKKIRDILIDFDASGLPVLSALPPLLRLFPDLLDDVVRRIRLGLFTTNDEQSYEAIGALFLWATHQVPCGAITAPPDLLRDFSSLVSSRFRPALFWSLNYGRKMVERLPHAQRCHLIPNFLIGLDYLLEETRYRTPADLVESLFRPDQIPEYRFRSSLLAVAVSRTSAGDHPTIKRWLEAISNDPLPEIRQAQNYTETEL